MKVPRRNQPMPSLDRMLIAVILLVIAGPAIAVAVGILAMIGKGVGLW